MPSKQVEECATRKIRHGLHAANIEFDQADCNPLIHYGCLLPAHPDADSDFLNSTILALKQQGLKVMMVWLGKPSVKSSLAWEWLRLGADDLIYWDGGEEAQHRLCARILRWLRLERQLQHIREQGMLVGESVSWKLALEQLLEAASFSTAPVLILGESGTGKEQAARLVHDQDTRPWKQELTLLDCSAIAPELSGSEFFGHEKGAFTHAVNAREGAFALADKGTLFLDEIGELPLSLQAELLRAVQEGAYKRVGGNQWRKTAFRLVSATNIPLEEAVTEKRFRTDLYYRISTWIIRLPPLRERMEDIPHLVEAFLKQALPNERRLPLIDPLVMAHLCAKNYPGNVRELRQVVFRMASRYTGTGIISIGDLADMDRPNLCDTSRGALAHPDFIQWVRKAIYEGQGLKCMVNRFSDLAKYLAIEAAQGNLQLASELLRVTDRTLQLHQQLQGSEKPGESGARYGFPTKNT